jgi:Arc/MetJ family transcription regulator
MRTTLNLRDDLVREASRLAGIDEKTALLHAGLQALIEKLAGQRLAALGASDPGLKTPRRRRAE